MNALLIIAHGSTRQESNDEVRRLAARIKDNAGPSFDEVTCAFLEIASPLIDSAIADLVDQGVNQIMVFPYFLSAGTHVFNDVPRIIDECREAHPGVEMEILPHMGALQGISTLILSQIYVGSRKSPRIQPTVEYEAD